jgi:hypothetical protein
MTGLARPLIRVFFHSIEIEDGENLPRLGAGLAAGQPHQRARRQLLLMAARRRYPRFQGKSTLFRIPLPCRSPLSGLSSTSSRFRSCSRWESGRRTRASRATVKLLGCFVPFAATYALLGATLSSRVRRRVGRARRGFCRTAVWLSDGAVHRGGARFGGVVGGCRDHRAQRNMLDAVLAHRAGVVREARAPGT